MAHNSMFMWNADAFVPDSLGTLIAGDLAAIFTEHNHRRVLAFDGGGNEMVAISPQQVIPNGSNGYGGGVLKGTILFYAQNDNSNSTAWELYVESITPDSDTLNLNSAVSFSSANTGTKSLSGSTVGDLLSLTITLTNDDSLAVGDLFRIGLRRDTLSVNDTASLSNMYFAHMEIWEDTA